MLSNNYLYAEVRIKGCNINTCQEKTAINGYHINLLMLNAHVDLANNQSLDEVTEYTIDGRKFINLDSTKEKVFILEFMKNQVSLDDAINKWFFGPTKFSFIS